MATSILQFVSDRRGELLGCESVLHLHSFRVGLEEGFRALKLVEVPEIIIWRRFREKMMSKYGKRSDDCLGIYGASSSHRESLDLYFREWKTFLHDEGLEPGTWDIPTPPIAESINLEDFFGAIRRRPHMYIVSKSTAHLRAIFSGIFIAIKFSRAQVQVKPDIEAFKRWLFEREGGVVGCSWDMLLTLHSGGNDEAAFERFFFLLDFFEAGANGNC